jgi:hypothetical protein
MTASVNPNRGHRWRELKVPLALARVRIKRDDGIAEEVVAIPANGSIDLGPGLPPSKKSC